MGRLLLSGVFVSLSCAAAALGAERSPSRLDVRPVVLAAAVADECPLGEEAIARAQREAARVWSRANVSIQWVPPSDLPFASDRSGWLLVRCGGAASPHTDAEPAPVLPLAAIRFIDAQPTNTIVLNLENANTLLQRDAPEPADQRGWFIPFREIRLGRMLGRAIAHEIGHFLHQSRAHTPGGLMRASHTLAALTGASLAPFSLDEAQARALHARRPPAQPGS